MLPARAGAETPVFQLTAAQIQEACREQIGRFKTRVRNIEQVPAGKRTFASVIMPFENAEADLNDTLAAPMFLSNVASDPSVREASMKCAAAASAVQIAMESQPLLYHAVSGAAKAHPGAGDAAHQLTRLMLSEMEHSGAALSPEKRSAFIADIRRIAALEAAFNARLTNETPVIPIAEADTKGLPPDLTATLGRDPAGGYAVPVSDATYLRFMRNVTNPDARRRYLFAFDNRGGEANVADLERTLALRDAAARLAGYSTWAAYALSDRMAGTPGNAGQLLADLRAQLDAPARAELEGLRARKVRETKDAAAVLEASDQPYYANEILKSDYAVDRDLVRTYFPVQHTVDAVLDLYARVLGVSFTRIDSPEAWSSEVTALRVSDAAGETERGTLFLDLFPRPGKYANASHFTLLPTRQVSGSLRPGITAVVGNWPRPGISNAGTMTYDEVESLFVAVGQALGPLLCTAPYERLSNGYRWDFDQAPSRMFANWLWDRGTIKALSSNLITGKPLPDATIDKLIAAHRFGRATAWLTEVTLAQIDLDYHSSARVDTGAVWRRDYAQTPLPPPPAGTSPQAGFSHIMSGYDAGYYGYVWAEVYGSDMFSEFQTFGPSSAAVGQRFRSDILEPGATYEPGELLERFLGRPANAGAFLAPFAPAPAQRP